MPENPDKGTAPARRARPAARAIWHDDGRYGAGDYWAGIFINPYLVAERVHTSALILGVGSPVG